MDQKKLNAIVQAAELIELDNLLSARQVISTDYPFIPVSSEKRTYTAHQMMEQFFKDGFIDRYSGEKLVNPGILRILSEKLPDAFPYHPHWKSDQCHTAYWEVHPTIDHIQPISFGGKDDEQNWASTSMIHNAMKSGFTLEQLGWEIKPKGNLCDWDGLSQLFIRIFEREEGFQKNKRINTWYLATKRCLNKYKEFL